MLPRNEIHVWSANVGNSVGNGLAKEQEDASRMVGLSASEIARATAMRSSVHRYEFIESRTILRQLLQCYLGVAADAITLDVNQYGKPMLGSEHAEALQFNISHSGGMAVFSFARHQMVGVDIDRLNRVMQWESIARRVFSIQEQQTLAALPLEQQHEACMRIWIAKEAYTKARGAGFQYGFPHFSVESTSRGAQLLADDKDVTAVNHWRLLKLDIPWPMAGVVAFEGADNTVVRHRCFDERLILLPLVDVAGDAP